MGKDKSSFRIRFKMKDILILVTLEEELPKDSLKEFHV